MRRGNGNHVTCDTARVINPLYNYESQGKNGIRVYREEMVGNGYDYKEEYLRQKSEQSFRERKLGKIKCLPTGKEMNFKVKSKSPLQLYKSPIFDTEESPERNKRCHNSFSKKNLPSEETEIGKYRFGKGAVKQNYEKMLDSQKENIELIIPQKRLSNEGFLKNFHSNIELH